MKIDITKKEHATITCDWGDMVSIRINKSQEPKLFIMPNFERNGWDIGFVGEGMEPKVEDFQFMKPEEN